MSRDLNDTLVFVKVIEKGSFTAAARDLRLPKTTVSRKVQELEKRLGVQLMHRTTRKLGLTEAGGVYFEHCQRISRDLDEAESAVAQLQEGPRGWLRFTAPYSIGINWVAPLLGQFHTRHPEVRVEMLLTDERLDLIEQGLDVALRLGRLPDSSLVARRLSGFDTRVYASHDYIKRHGEPGHPDELAAHRTLAMRGHRRGERFVWPLSTVGESGDYAISPVLVSNDPAPLRGALLCGEGITLASQITMKPFLQSGHVKEILPGWAGPFLELNAVFPKGPTLSPKVRAFVDFLVERLDFDVMLSASACRYAEGGYGLESSVEDRGVKEQAEDRTLALPAPAAAVLEADTECNAPCC